MIQRLRLGLLIQGVRAGGGAKIPHVSWPRKQKYKTEAILQQIQ